MRARAEVGGRGGEAIAHCPRVLLYVAATALQNFGLCFTPVLVGMLSDSASHSPDFQPGDSPYRNVEFLFAAQAAIGVVAGLVLFGDTKARKLMNQKSSG